MTRSAAATVCYFNVSLGLLIEIRAANGIWFAEAFGQWCSLKFKLQPIESLDT